MSSYLFFAGQIPHILTSICKTANVYRSEVMHMITKQNSKVEVFFGSLFSQGTQQIITSFHGFDVLLL